ncbi:MAG: energy-coupling factor ABC transporter permease [Candidatus Micrarchaeota archaeon]
MIVMHTPDGFITSWICVLMLIVSGAVVSLALWNLRKNISREKAIRIASFAALIFAAQMINFPIASGTSGHLIGAALAFLIFGADAAVIIIACVLLVQSFVFGDGGALALGANVFNMAIIGVYSARVVYEKTKSIVATSWFSVVAASTACAIELGLSGTVPIVSALVAMVSVHAVIGIGEGLITLVAYNIFANRTRFASLNFATATVGTSIFIVAILTPFASQNPDGLDSVAINLGFFEKATQIYNAPVPEYAIQLVGIGAYLSTVIAGIIGILGTFFLVRAGTAFVMEK